MILTQRQSASASANPVPLAAAPRRYSTARRLGALAYGLALAPASS